MFLLFGLKVKLILFLLLFNEINCRESASVTNCYDNPKDASFDVTESIKFQPVWNDEQNKNMIYNYDWSYDLQYIDEESQNTMRLDITPWLKPMRTIYKLIIPKYGLRPRYYFLYVYSRRKNNINYGPYNALSGGRKTCHLPISGLRPVVIITGGAERVVPTRKPIVVSGENSYDPNYAEKVKEGLRYEWRCSEKRKKPYFCTTEDIISTDSKFTIPASKALENTIVVELTVYLPYADGKKFVDTATQTIRVVKDAAELTVRKNCEPAAKYSNYQVETFIIVECLKNCKNLREKDFFWTITSKEDKKFKFDYKKYSKYGRSGFKFIIEKNALKPGNYTIKCEVKESLGKASTLIHLNFVSPPDIKDCKIMPEKGDSLNTLFTFSCNQEQEDETNFYELYTKENSDNAESQLIVDGFYPEVQSNQFKLPLSQNRTFYIVVTKEGYPNTRIEVFPTVVSATDNKTTEEAIEILDKFYNAKNGSDPSISELLKSNDADDRSQGLKGVQSIVNEISTSNINDSKFNEFVDEFRTTVTEDLADAPLDSFSDVLMAVDALNQLNKFEISESKDPSMDRHSTEVCRDMAQKSFELLKEEKYPHNLEEKTEKMSRTMIDCLEDHSKANNEIMQPLEVGVTTKAPVLDDFPLITESYENYEDPDETFFENLQNMKAITENTLNGTATAAKMIAMTAAIGQDVIKNLVQQQETSVLKDVGSELFKKEIKSQGVTLKPSRDFADDDHPYDILLTVWTKNIIWWYRKLDIVTDVINCEFWHSTCKEKVINFSEPVDIYFHLRNDTNFTLKIHNYSLVIPEGYDYMIDEQLNYQIKVHRMLAKPHQEIAVKFICVDTLHVVVTMNKYPTIEDFHNFTVVTTNHSTVKFINKQDFEVLCYVGLMVSREEAIENQTVDYEFSAYESGCVAWNRENSTWNTACKPSGRGNVSVIHCECTDFKLTVLAGFMNNVPSKRQDLIILDLELQVYATNVVFYVLLITLIVYFILLLLLLFETKEKIYFVADNHLKDRFAYLVVVNTGMGFGTGTTTNVIINLCGDKKSSGPHVLNYPDPKLKILQNFNCDKFIISTRGFLGELERIEIWFDSVGTNPTWYCRNIIVYDMQQHTQWYFNVEKLFSVVKHIVHVVLKPTIKETPNSVYKTDSKFRYYRTNLLLILKQHTWILWHKDENFSFLKKITIVLSTILTIYSLSLCFFGLPELKMRDAFDVYEVFRIEENCLIIAVESSICAFIPHIIITWIFRLSKVQISKYEQNARLASRWTIVTWFCLIIFILFSSSFLIIYGFWLPTNSSFFWLLSAFLAIIFVPILETLFLFILSFFYRKKLIYNIRKKFEDIWTEIEGQRKYLYGEFGEQLLRPYFEHLYKPLEEKEIKEKFLFLRHRFFIIAELQDLIMFGIYVVILYVVVLANRDNLIVEAKTSIISIMEGKHTRTVDFNEVDNIHNIYNYINATLIPSLQPVHWYENYAISSPGLMIDIVTKYIGVARLRQQRIKSNLCHVPEKMDFINISCYPEYSLKHTEKKTFGYLWEKYPPVPASDRLSYIWIFKSEGKTGTLPIVGELATYSGGGYTAFLGRTLHNSVLNFYRLLRKLWIDEETRVIFIEFLTYNANYNIFSAVRMSFEQSATGYIYNRIFVSTVRMLFINNEFESLTITFFFLFIVWVGMLFIKKSLGLIQNIRTFYKNIWLLLDFVIILMSIACILLYFIRTSSIGKYLDTMEKAKKNEFLNYFYLFYIENVLTFIAAFLVCIATIRLWKFLRFALMFRILEKTLSIAMFPLLNFALITTLNVFMFAATLILIVGYHYEKYYNFMRLCRLLLSVPLRAVEIDAKKFIPFKVSWFYLILAQIIMKITAFTFIMIIVMAYSEAQKELSSEMSSYTIKNYVLERFYFFNKLLKYKYRRERGGENSGNKVEPKSDKFVYSNSISLQTSKVKKMKSLTECILRNIRVKNANELSHIDVDLMLEVCENYLLKIKNEEVEVFYKGRVKGSNMKLVNERKIEKIACVVNVLLQENLSFSDFEHRSRIHKYLDKISKSQKTLKLCEMRLRMISHQIDNCEIQF